MNQALPMVYLVRHGETAWTLTAQHTGRTDLPLNEQGERQARELGARLTALRFGRIRAHGGDVLVFAHRDILRLLAVRWIGLAAIEGRRLLLATAALCSLGYDHDLTEPVIHVWNER